MGSPSLNLLLFLNDVSKGRARRGNAELRVEPFDAVSLELGALWVGPDPHEEGEGTEGGQ